MLNKVISPYEKIHNFQKKENTRSSSVSYMKKEIYIDDKGNQNQNQNQIQNQIKNNNDSIKKLNLTNQKIKIPPRSNNINTNNTLINLNNTNNRNTNTNTGKRNTISIERIHNSNSNSNSNLRKRSYSKNKNISDIYNDRIEKINTLETECENLENDNILIIKFNSDNDVYVDKLKKKNKEISVIIKGIKEEINDKIKSKGNLNTKYTNLKNEIELRQRDFEFYKITKEHEINTRINNSKLHLFKNDDQRNSIKKKIDIEENLKEKLEFELKDINDKIDYYRSFSKIVDDSQQKCFGYLAKINNDMEKFLNEI
jgi:hypothetical protein